MRSVLRNIALVATATLISSACQARNADTAAATGAGPVETRPPEGNGQKPAFPGQTRAPGVHSKTAYQTSVVVSGLDHPWALQFLPDGRMLVSERPGRLRIIGADGKLSAPVEGVPAVEAKEQGGLQDVALDPGFAKNHTLYFTYLEGRTGGSGITVARAVLSDGGGSARLTDVKVIFRAEPGYSDDKNVGSRVVVAPDGNLFVTIGDRFKLKDKAQSLDNDLGKVIRITTDGAPAKGNPFIGKAGARPEIWSYGHRNSESAAINPADGRLWTVEHGARGGDEVDIPQAGKNYGWPVITYGIDYSGLPIGQGITQHAGMEQPLYYWDPVIAPSGMAFYTGKLFPEWQGNLLVGGLRGKQVARLVLKGAKVVGEERLLTELNKRIRDVRVGPDGAVYVLTDDKDGAVIRVTPK
jgi:glucose/arabinose dehydrogenase